jgi:RNA ligase (TIGR02306 family)
MERKLASIRQVSEIKPIEGADVIELAIVDGWNVVVAKNVNHKVGDYVVYCEIDSFLPIKPEFEFLRKTSYKKMGDQEGFRLKTIKLRGQISQGLILPLDEVIPFPNNLDYMEVGKDVTELLGIVKYEPPIPAELAGKVKGLFPSFIRKTDEERVQNLVSEYENWKVQSQHKFYVTEKLDGSSVTFYYKDGVFGVCSRNLELSDPGEFVPGTIMCEDGIERPKKENTFWKVARELNLKEKLEANGKNISLQGELIGEGIQGNPYKVKGHTVRFFTGYDIDNQKRINFVNLVVLLQSMGLEYVPVLNQEYGFVLPETVEDMLKYAEGKSVLNLDTEREGVVVRSMDGTISFKAISNKFLLKNNQ